MISKQRILEISNLVNSRLQSGLEALSSVAASIRSSWQREVSIVSFLTDIVNSSDPQFDYILDQETIEFVESLINSNEEVVLNINSTDCFTLRIGQAIRNVAPVILNDFGIGTYNLNTHILKVSSVVTDLPVGYMSILENQVKKLSRRCGSEYALADICDLASSGNWTSDTNLASALYTKITSYESVLGSYSTELLSAIAGGPLVLLQLIEALVSKIANVSDVSDLSQLLSSTDIVLNNFSAGVITQTIGSIISAVGVVVACFSRIAGAVIAVAGAITTVVGRIVVSATTAFDDTQYKVVAGCEVTHAFSFVVDQDVVTDAGVAKFMRDRGWDRMTVLCPMQAAVYMMYLDEYDSATNNLIHYEVHLSSDIDISQNVSEVLIDNSGVSALVVDCPDKISDTVFQCSLAYMPEYTISDEGKIQSSYFVIKNHSSSDDTTPKYAVSIEKGFWNANLLFPADFNLFEQLKQWYSGDLTNYLDVRLCSAFILYLGWKLTGAVSKGWSKFSGNQNILLGVRHYTTDVSNTAFMLLENVWANAWKCFCSTNSFTEQHKLKQDFGLSDTERSNLLTSIRLAYDQLVYKQRIPSTLTQLPIRVQGDGVGGVTVTEIGYAGHDLDQYDINEIILSKVDFASATLTTDMLAQCASGVWNINCAISLPTLTFTGFIAGLIVDGLVIAAMAIVTVAVVVGWVKVKNKRSQLQAKAESSWYAYQDDQTASNWKTYKRDRFKYNVLAVCTGGTMLNLGLYDDTTSYADILPSIKGFVSGTEEADNITLKDVLLSIKGAV